MVKGQDARNKEAQKKSNWQTRRNEKGKGPKGGEMPGNPSRNQQERKGSRANEKEIGD